MPLKDEIETMIMHAFKKLKLKAITDAKKEKTSKKKSKKAKKTVVV